MWKFTLEEGNRTLPDDVEMPGGIEISHRLITTSEGIAKFRPDPRPNPITAVLKQPIGHDLTMLELFGMKAGFKLKATLSLPVAGDDNSVTDKDIWDINLSDVVPESLLIDDEWVLTLRTLTPAEIIPLNEPPKRRNRSRVLAGD